jgi:hypothetical protein
MDTSIRAATILNSWMGIENLIDRSLIIATLHQKSKRTTTSVGLDSDSDGNTTETGRVVSSGSTVLGAITE